MGTDGFGCQICGTGTLAEIDGFSALWRETSDCTAFHQGGRLCVCDTSGAMQKIPDEQWLC